MSSWERAWERRYNVKRNPADPPSPVPEHLTPWAGRSNAPMIGPDDLRIAPSTAEMRNMVRALNHDNMAGQMLVTMREGSPWLEFDVAVPFHEPAVDQPPGIRRAGGVYRYALWRFTGAVYRIGPDGAVEDDPIDLS